MIVDERKMLKKYLQECSPEEKRGKSTPKNLPYWYGIINKIFLYILKLFNFMNKMSKN